jgi:hypothetical protein
VALHVATAVALGVFFRADWMRIIRGFLRSIRTRRKLRISFVASLCLRCCA